MAHPITEFWNLESGLVPRKFRTGQKWHGAERLFSRLVLPPTACVQADRLGSCDVVEPPSTSIASRCIISMNYDYDSCHK